MVTKYFVLYKYLIKIDGGKNRSYLHLRLSTLFQRVSLLMQVLNIFFFACHIAMKLSLSSHT